MRAEMRLGIDLDGVVTNFVRGWMLRYNMEFGTALTEDMVDHWDAARDLTHFTDLSDFWQWAGASGHGTTVFRNLEPYPGAIETLHELAICHDIVILSMKPDWAAADTYRWLADHRIPTRGPPPQGQVGRQVRHLPGRLAVCRLVASGQTTQVHHS